MRRLFGLALVCLLAPLTAASEAQHLEPTEHALADAETHQAKVQEAALKRAMRRLSEELDLDDDQARRMQPILKQHYADLQQVRIEVRDLEGHAARQAFDFESQQLRDVMHEKLRDVLTEPQLARFIELRSQMKHRAMSAQDPK